MADSKKRVRSPKFPFIDLGTAIKRADSFYQSEKRNSANIPVAMKAWDYNEKSSGGLQTISALKEFGLLEDSGSKEARRVKLTERALRIILDKREVSPERDALVREAALLPGIYQNLWEHYNHELGSDSNLRHYLMFDYETPFNENSVDDFIKHFRATLTFAGLTESDTISDGDGDKDDEERHQEIASMIGVQKGKPPPPPPSKDSPYITFPLPRGNNVEIRLRAKLSPAEFEQLKQLVDLVKPSIVESQE